MAIVTTGRTRTPTELAQMIITLEARAALAERDGLRHTAKSWRDTIASLRYLPCMSLNDGRRSSERGRSFGGARAR